MFATESYRSESGKLSYTCGCSQFSANNSSETPVTATGQPEATLPVGRSSCMCVQSSTVYRRGAAHVFRTEQSAAIVPARVHSSAWQFNLHRGYFPVVIECRPVDARLRDTHAHVTLAYVDKTVTRPMSDELDPNSVAPAPAPAAYQIKPIKQKQLINGVLFCLQEVYGIERKNTTISTTDDTKLDDHSALPTVKLPVIYILVDFNIFFSFEFMCDFSVIDYKMKMFLFVFI